MLLPAFSSCDPSHASLTRLPATLFRSPPASPPQLSTQPGFGNILRTCRSLQTLLATPAPFAAAQAPSTPPMTCAQLPTPATPPLAPLPTPPLAHAPPPAALRLRVRRSDTDAIARKRVVKRAVPCRGVNKRRRASDDDAGRETGEKGGEKNEVVESDLEDGRLETRATAEPGRPQTPKRARIAPEVLPMGLERSDYHGLYRDGELRDDRLKEAGNGDDVVTEADGERWSEADDQMLVELVLEKLQLSKADWQDCARSLGRDGHSLGRRWKSLMLDGNVGLRRCRRTRLHGTWR